MIKTSDALNWMMFIIVINHRGVLRVGSIPVAILPACQGMKTIA